MYGTGNKKMLNMKWEQPMNMDGVEFPLIIKKLQNGIMQQLNKVIRKLKWQFRECDNI